MRPFADRSPRPPRSGPADAGPWGAPPVSPGERARRVAGGTVRVVIGLPLFAVSSVSGLAVSAVNDLARLIEGKR